MESQIAALQARVEGFQRQLMQTGTTMGAGTVDAKRWNAASKSINAMSDAYRAAASSSGLLSASQLKVNSETERYTDLLQRQKLSLRDMLTNQKRMSAVYRDQLRLQRMTVTSRGTDKFGREVSDITVPNQIPKSLDTINNKLKYTRTLIDSASTQMVNWGKNVQWAGRQLTVGLTMPMAMFAAASGKMAYDVDKQLTRIAKVYDTTLSKESLSAEKAKELGNMRTASLKQAIDLAKEYGAAVTDTLEVEANLAATGLNGDKLLQATKEVMRISALGELDTKQATDMTVALQTAFKDTIKTTKDLTDTFDYMNYVENTTSLSIQDIAEATPRAASGLASLGVTAKQMTVLLVAMREAGVDAAEGANALKSATTKILNVTPEAEQRFAGKLSGQFKSVQEMSDAANGNLYKFLQLLAKGTKDMDSMGLQKGIAKLFGTYQYNRLNAALKGVTDAMFGFGGGTSQAAKAMDGLNKSSAELASISAGELAKQAASMSGQFQRGWQTLKGELAEIGQALLPVGTEIMDILVGILDVSQKLGDAIPEWIKPLLKFITAAVAIAGPAIMLAGLMGNLTGWGMKIIGLGPKMGILNRAQKAAELQADQTKIAYINEAEAVSVLTAELNALAQAQGYSIGVAAKAEKAARGGYALGMAGQGSANVSGYTSKRSAAEIRAGLGLPAKPDLSASGVVKEGVDKNGRTYFMQEKGLRATKEQINEYKRLQGVSATIRQTEQDTLKTRLAASQATRATTTNVEESAKGMGALAKTAGAAQVAMLGAMVTSGKMQAGLMTAGTGLMAASALGSMGVGSKIKDAWTPKATAGMSKFSATASTTFTKVGAMASKFGTMLVSPWGAAAVAAGAAGYLMYRQLQKPIEQQKKINDSVSAWATTLDVVKKKYAAIDLSTNKYSDTSVSTVELSERFANTDQGKAVVGAYKDNKDNKSYQNMLAAQEYIKILTQTNATAEDAQRGIEALFLASGKGFFEASREAAALREEIGDTVGAADTKNLWGQQIKETMDANENQVKVRAQGIAQMLTVELQRAPDVVKQDKVLLDFQTTFNGMSKEQFEEKVPKEIREKLMDAFGGDQQKAIDFVVNFANAPMINGNKMPAIGAGLSGDENKAMNDLLSKGLKGGGQDIAQMAEQQKVILDTIRDELGIKEKIYSIDQLRATSEWQVHTTTLKNVQARVTALKTEAQLAFQKKFLTDKDGAMEDRNAAKDKINLYLKQAGLQEISDLYDNIDWTQIGVLLNEQKHNNVIDQKTQKLQAALAIWQQFKGDGPDAGWVAADKGIMSATTNAMADAAQAGLQQRQQAAQDSLQAGIDAESAALDKRGEHWDEYYDKAIKAANDYADKRIDAINKMISVEEEANKTRERIFAAEQKRLQRTAENQNSQIDWQMALNEGNLDEAAKIANNAQATSAKNQMDDELAKADARLDAQQKRADARVKRLEKERDKKVEGLEAAQKAKQKAIAAAKEQAAAVAAVQTKALAAQQKREADAQQRGLALLRAFIPRNKKELMTYMKELDEKYNIFGGQLKAKGNQWATMLRNEHTQQMKLAANDLKSQVNWAGAGYDGANAMLQGMAKAMGFSGVGQLKKWLGLDTKSAKRPELSTGTFANRSPDQQAAINEGRHKGGIVGGGGSDRTGFSGSTSANERIVRAQVGEGFVNKKAVDHYGTEAIRALNDRKLDLGASGGAAGTLAMGAMMVPAIMRTAMTALGTGLSKKAKKTSKAMSSFGAPGGSFGAGQPGKYGGTMFDASQLMNAATIASVGNSMGMSQRDIVIGLMTAMQESMLRNVNYGDRDSLGLFQQRPSMGWGTPAQVTDPNYASRKFFEGLKGVEDRDKMSLSAAAQAVQRSAFPDAYAKWEDEARAILQGMKVKVPGGPGGGSNSAPTGNYVPGAGGKHRPINAGVTGTHGWQDGYNAMDFSAPIGTPVYAVGSGRVTTGVYRGYESRRKLYGQTGPSVQDGYRSYGKFIKLAMDGGGNAMYAHLSSQAVQSGMRVPGGSVIGYSGNTGNVQSNSGNGAHLHWGTNGPSPYTFLRNGGELRYDNTQVIGHRKETMLSAPLTKKFKEGINDFANGGNTGYNVTVDLRGAYIREELDIKGAVKTAIKEIENDKGRKRVVK